MTPASFTLSKPEPCTRLGDSLLDAPEVGVRALHAGDEDRLRRMFSRTSRDTIHKRFHLPIPRVPEGMLDYLASKPVHQDRKALISLVGDEAVGHAMYVRSENLCEAEIAIVVEDAWQSKGIGKLLLTHLAEEARRLGIKTLTGTVLGENRGALRFFSATFPEARFAAKDGLRYLRLPLQSPAGSETRTMAAPRCRSSLALDG